MWSSNPPWAELGIVWARVAKNISLRGNLDSLADISPKIAWFTGQLGLYKSILVTRNHLLSQEINSCHKKTFLVSSYPLVKLINLSQRVNPTKKFAWAYTFRGNLVPKFPVNLPPWLGGNKEGLDLGPILLTWVGPIGQQFQKLSGISRLKNIEKLRFCLTLTYRNYYNSLNFWDRELISWI